MLDNSEEAPTDLYDEIGAGATEWWKPPDAVFVDPKSPTRPELYPEARALENTLISHFDGHDLTLPPLLHVAEKVLSRLGSGGSGLAELAGDVGEDPVIAAAVLRMANSPLYRGMNKINAIQPALNRLGTKALRTLMLHESLRSAVISRRGPQREWGENLWKRSLASAYVMRRIAELTGLDPEEAWLMGLLHDIGNIVVLRIAAGQGVFSGGGIDDEVFEYLCFECHQEFGELIANAWRLPPTLHELIRDHHNYPTEENSLRAERLHLLLSDMICQLLGYMPFRPFDLLESRPVADLGLKDRKGFLELLEVLPAELAENLEAL